MSRSNQAIILGLTQRQSEALDDLNKRGYLFFTGSGRFKASGTNHPPYSKKTLQALVDKGYARWGSPVGWPKIEKVMN